jgi:hypothetical protein
MELNIFKRKHIMCDLETLATYQNSVIVSIGAVRFTFENGIEDEFLVNVDPKSCVAHGLKVEKSTIEWWQKQPKEVSDLWKIDPQPLDVALNQFNEFVGSDSKQFLWSLGAVFDLGVIRSAYEATKIDRSWKYWNEMDARTVFNLLNIRNDKIRKNESGYHSALDDAKSQAKTLIDAFNN